MAERPSTPDTTPKILDSFCSARRKFPQLNSMACGVVLVVPLQFANRAFDQIQQIKPEFCASLKKSPTFGFRLMAKLFEVQPWISVVELPRGENRQQRGGILILETLQPMGTRSEIHQIRKGIVGEVGIDYCRRCTAELIRVPVEHLHDQGPLCIKQLLGKRDRQMLGCSFVRLRSLIPFSLLYVLGFLPLCPYSFLSCRHLRLRSKQSNDNGDYSANGSCPTPKCCNSSPIQVALVRKLKTRNHHGARHSVIPLFYEAHFAMLMRRAEQARG